MEFQCLVLLAIRHFLSVTPPWYMVGRGLQAGHKTAPLVPNVEREYVDDAFLSVVDSASLVVFPSRTRKAFSPGWVCRLPFS